MTVRKADEEVSTPAVARPCGAIAVVTTTAARTMTLPVALNHSATRRLLPHAAVGTLSETRTKRSCTTWTAGARNEHRAGLLHCARASCRLTACTEGLTSSAREVSRMSLAPCARVVVASFELEPLGGENSTT